MIYLQVLICVINTLYIFSGTPEKYNEKAYYKVADTEAYAHPIIAGDRFYVKDKEMRTCWSLN